MNNQNLHKSAHFIGIGGISMSALAHIMLTRGYRVSGSDRGESDMISRLRQAGAEIMIGHSAENIKNPDVVVYTAAIAKDNPELVCAREKGLTVLERADFLGMLMQEYNMPIAVSGTHGKTTTTSMLSCVLLKAGLNPTIQIGGELDAIGGNYRIGGDQYFVFEACEYVDSFLKFYPYTAIVLNVEADHLDYFSGIEQIKQSFHKFINKIPQDSFVVLNADSKSVMDCAKDVKCEKITFGKNGMYHAENICFAENGCATFDVYKEDKMLITVNLSVTGTHNILNALSVFAMADKLGVPHSVIAEGIESFKGAKRRFEKRCEICGASVYDDYAHHPTEISATITAAKRMKHNKIRVVFQPHTYTRTKMLLNDFAAALKEADEVIITDIYAAREKNDGSIHAKNLADKIEGAKYIGDFNEITDYLKKTINKDDIIIAMGAGTVNTICDLIQEN